MISCTCNAQLPDSVIDYWVNKLSSFEHEETDQEELLEELERMHANKINLNVSAQLEKCILFRSDQKDEIQLYKNIYGPLLSLYELQRISSIDKEELVYIKPFIQLSSQYFGKPLKKNLQEWTLSYRLTTPLSSGYLHNNYQGNPLHAQFRYKMLKDPWNIELRMEKDAGESWALDGSWKPDYISGFVDYATPKYHLILGDFQIRSGLGLNLSTSPAYSDFGVDGLLTAQTGVSAYRSFNEDNYLRGVALELSHSVHRFTAFYSFRTRDGYGLTDSSFSSWALGGLHRSSYEKWIQGNINEWLMGNTYRMHLASFDIGGSIYYRILDHHRDLGDELYKKFRRDEAIQSEAALFMTYRHDQHTIQLEISSTFAPKRPNVILIYLVNIFNQLDLGISWRTFSADHASILTNPLAVSSEEGSENGLEMRATLSRKLTFSCNLYRNDWIRYQLDLLPYFSRWRLEYTYKKRHRYSLQLHCRSSAGPVYDRESNNYWQVSTNQGRIHLLIEAQQNLELRLRVEHKWIPKAKLSGSLSYAEVVWKASKTSSLGFRITQVSTDHYSVRMYAYERVPLGHNALNTYTHSGTYFYSFLRSQLNEDWTLWFKFQRMQILKARSSFDHTPVIGSMNDTINGWRKNTFALQLRYRLQ